jgi:hypothetical protein
MEHHCWRIHSHQVLVSLIRPGEIRFSYPFRRVLRGTPPSSFNSPVRHTFVVPDGHALASVA